MTNRRQCSKFDIIPYYKILFAFYIYLRRVSPVEQELRTLPEHLSSPPVFSWVRVTQSLVLCVCFVDRCLSCCFFLFGHWCCMCFFNLRILITPLVSSNFSFQQTYSIYVRFFFDPWHRLELKNVNLHVLKWEIRTVIGYPKMKSCSYVPVVPMCISCLLSYFELI